MFLPSNWLFSFFAGEIGKRVLHAFMLVMQMVSYEWTACCLYTVQLVELTQLNVKRRVNGKFNLWKRENRKNQTHHIIESLDLSYITIDFFLIQ